MTPKQAAFQRMTGSYDRIATSARLCMEDVERRDPEYAQLLIEYLDTLAGSEDIPKLLRKKAATMPDAIATDLVLWAFFGLMTAKQLSVAHKEGAG